MDSAPQQSEPWERAMSDLVERARIVEWLRDYAGCLIRSQETALLSAADAIERGDHLRTARDALSDHIDLPRMTLG